MINICVILLRHIQGYNGQALVDSKHQIVASAEAFGQGSDADLMEPLVDLALENYQAMGEKKDFFEGKTILADTGYFSETNLKKADKMKMDIEQTNICDRKIYIQEIYRKEIFLFYLSGKETMSSK